MGPHQCYVLRKLGAIPILFNLWRSATPSKGGCEHYPFHTEGGVERNFGKGEAQANMMGSHGHCCH